MTDPVDALVLDLLEWIGWIGPSSRPYADVMSAWRTSCPRLPVCEEANVRGYIAQTHRQGVGAMVSVTPAGVAALASRNGTKGS